MKTAQISISCEWINHMWSIHTVEYYSTIKRNKAPLNEYHDEPQNIMLSEKNWAQQNHILCKLIYMNFPREANLLRQKYVSDGWHSGGWRGGRRRVIADKDGVCLGVSEVHKDTVAM
jgi:hypothetical protein